MVHCSRRRTLGTLLALAMLIALTTFLVVVGNGRAEEPAVAEPTVVRELVEKRTADSNTYLLSNGAYRCVMWASDVNYQDEKGEWLPIDATLVPVEGSAALTTASAPVRVTLQGEAPEAAPVTVTSGKWTVGLDLIGSEESGLTYGGAEGTFPDVAKDASVTYTALGTGVKEVITLASPAAPDSYAYRLTHPGLELRADKAAQWGLYAPGEKEPVFLVGPMNASDSSSDEAGEPAWCDEARLAVEAGTDESTLTFSLPRAWLSDPARTYPVLIDPQIILSGADTRDTYISRGYPNTAYGSDADLLCGNMNSDAERCWTLVRFPQVETAIPAGSHISEAKFLLRQYWQPATNSDTVHVAMLSRSAPLWGNASTWNGVASDLLVKSEYHTEEVAGAAWMQVVCKGAVQYWLDKGGNRGFKVFESDGSGSGYSRKFRSNEYADATYRPHLTVDYEAPGVTVGGVSSTYHLRDTLTVTAQATSVANAGQIKELRIGVNRADADESKYHGVLGWFKEPPIGDPNWVYETCEGGGYVAYYNSTARGVTHIEPLLDSCSWNPATKTATFAFTASEEWTPLEAGNSVDSVLKMSAGDQTWSSGWTAKPNSFQMLPYAGPPSRSPA